MPASRKTGVLLQCGLRRFSGSTFLEIPMFGISNFGESASFPVGGWDALLAWIFG
jgi:hypothetical protein